MGDLLDTASSGGLSAAATIGSSLIGAHSAKKLNKSNKKLAREQMAFQERMSSSAHQRETRDLRLAGLNPILSATGGAGASTPPGATPSQSQEFSGDFGDNIAETIRRSPRQIAELKNLRTQTKGVEIENELKNVQLSKEKLTGSAHDLFNQKIGFPVLDYFGKKFDSLSHTIRNPKHPTIPGSDMNNIINGTDRTSGKTSNSAKQIGKNQKAGHRFFKGYQKQRQRSGRLLDKVRSIIKDRGEE